MSEMSILSSAMTLWIWLNGGDPYSHEQLADNFLKLDQHDHSPGKGIQIPTAGLRDESVTTEKIAKGAITNSQLSSEVSSVPTGGVMPFAGTSAPEHWLKCEGQEINRTTYARLFEVIGTTYGSGNGTSTFNVPDLRNRFVIGAGSTYSNGSKGGASEKTLSASNIPPHHHNYEKMLETEATIEKGTGETFHYIHPNGYSTTETTSTGSAQPFTMLPPYFGLTFIIKI